MGKQKIIVWSFVGLSVAVAVSGGVFYWHASRTQATQRVSIVANTTAGAALGATDSNGNLIIHDTTVGSSPTIAGGTTTQNQQVAGASTTTPSTASSNSNAAAKLLDPTTFAQYDKYKNDSSAYFIDLQTGSGDTLSSGKQAAVYYRGWLTNGTVFDQSRAGSDGNLQPFMFTLGQHQVISGWEQAMDGMKVGGVRLLIIPPSVGYGASGQSSIPGNSVLVFQVQLAAVQ